MYYLINQINQLGLVYIIHLFLIVLLLPLFHFLIYFLLLIIYFDMFFYNIFLLILFHFYKNFHHLHLIPKAHREKLIIAYSFLKYQHVPFYYKIFSRKIQLLQDILLSYILYNLSLNLF